MLIVFIKVAAAGVALHHFALPLIGNDIFRCIFRISHLWCSSIRHRLQSVRETATWARRPCTTGHRHFQTALLVLALLLTGFCITVCRRTKLAALPAVWLAFNNSLWQLGK